MAGWQAGALHGPPHGCTGEARRASVKVGGACPQAPLRAPSSPGRRRKTHRRALKPGRGPVRGGFPHGHDVVSGAGPGRSHFVVQRGRIHRSAVTLSRSVNCCVCPMGFWRGRLEQVPRDLDGSRSKQASVHLLEGSSPAQPGVAFVLAKAWSTTIDSWSCRFLSCLRPLIGDLGGNGGTSRKPRGSLIGLRRAVQGGWRVVFLLGSCSWPVGKMRERKREMQREAAGRSRVCLIGRTQLVEQCESFKSST